VGGTRESKARLVALRYRARALPGLLLSCLLPVTGCVTEVVDADPFGVDGSALPAMAVPVAIPLGGPSLAPGGAAADAYYQSVVQQLQDAVLERDPDRLAGLLATHDRDVAPAWSKPVLQRFRGLLAPLRFERFAAEASELEVPGGVPPLGSVVPMRLRIPAAPGAGLLLPGEDRRRVAATRILVEVTAVDLDCLGGRFEREFTDLLPLAESVDMGAGEALEVAFALPSFEVEGCARLVEVRCSLVPGTAFLDGEPVPLQGTSLAGRAFELLPRGIEGVLEHPYTHLRNGLDSSEPKHLDNVFLAARSMPVAFREAAIERCVEKVRNGRPLVARAAMAALCEMTGRSISVENRDGWLAWAQARSR
jgi:hypothetical protein